MAYAEGYLSKLERAIASRFAAPFLAWIEAVSARLSDSQSVSNLATGGSVGTAATTVDLVGLLLVSQTTAAQTLTLPNPIDGTVPGKRITVTNIGSVAFTMLGAAVPAGGSMLAVWSGVAWARVS